MLFRMFDVGKYKADVAAAQINKRILGTNVVPHCCRIEDKGIDFYEQFNVFVLGLDSLEARRYMNMIACSFLGVLLGCVTATILSPDCELIETLGRLQNTVKMERWILSQ